MHVLVFDMYIFMVGLGIYHTYLEVYVSVFKMVCSVVCVVTERLSRLKSVVSTYPM